MLVRKVNKGLYEVIDLNDSQYRVENSNRCNAFKQSSTDKWNIYEQSKNKWVRLSGEPTLRECLRTIGFWYEASQLGK